MMIKWLQQKISGIFYHHGLFCASHPFAIISFVIVVAMFLCYPLVNLPLPGIAPMKHSTPLNDYSGVASSLKPGSDSDQDLNTPRWYLSRPVVYAQQVVVKATVAPWDDKKLIHIDAFRAPLLKAFEVLEHIQNFQHKEGDETYNIDDLCLRVTETLREKGVKAFFPEYKCLILSPANFWAQDKNKFLTDGEILKTVYQKYLTSLDSPPSLRDVLFGVPWKDTGISRLFFRNRQRVITFAFTMVYNKFHAGYVRGLQESLQHFYPLSPVNNVTADLEVVHYHYRDIDYVVEYTPLLVTYMVLFMYLYFSVRKIEMVKSKWGLALSAVVSVIASLLISVAVCLTFGLTPSLNGSEIFPYLVVIIGLENVLVVTKSVVSTPHHLDVKYRVAQGLSKEGWYIFKNLMAELLIVIVGFFTFVPAIQEFCLFALVGLWTDFFLQMFFFTTVLSVDIRRMELSDLQNHPLHPSITKEGDSSPSNQGFCPVMTHLTLNPYTPGQTYPTTLYIPPTPVEGTEDPMAWGWRTDRTPRRVRLLNFWASTRMVQRALMLSVIVWIGLLLYKTGVVEHLARLNATLEELTPAIHQPLAERDPLQTWSPDASDPEVIPSELLGQHQRASDDDHVAEVPVYAPTQLAHDEGPLWEKLSHNHWPALLGVYNISLFGKYISILPSIPISMVIAPHEAKANRHEKETKAAAALETARHWTQRAANPQGKFDLVLTGLLGFATVLIMTYILMVLWKCLCPRRYDKWRPWSGRKSKSRKGSQYYKQIRESVPLILQGHEQTIDCIMTDGPWVISSCLGGQIRVWDSMTGESLTVIERTWVSPPKKMNREPIAGRNTSDSDADLYAEYHDNQTLGTTSSDYSAECTDEYLSLLGSQSDISGSQPNSARSSRSSSFVAPSPGTPGTTRARRRSGRHTRHKSADIYMEEFAPDLSEMINTSFATPEAGEKTRAKSMSQSSVNEAPVDDRGDADTAASGQDGYDFKSHFGEFFSKHWDNIEDRNRHLAKKEERLQEQRAWSREFQDEDSVRKRSRSLGDNLGSLGVSPDGSTAPAIWCLDCRDNLIVVGCGNGRIEFWDGMTGQLKCMYHGSHDPVTAICFTGNKVICSRLMGNIDFLELETFVNFNSSNTVVPSTNLQHRGASSLSSHGGGSEMKSWDDIIHCTLLNSAAAHQRPINLLQYAGGRVVTGSQDHTLKVYRLEDTMCLYTLHGHNGGVTALYLDKVAPLAAASGAEDGSVRLWDLLTGSCVHKLAGHDEAVTSLTCTTDYIISSGIDDRLCIWERRKGRLLQWIQMESGVCNCLAMLTSNLMITGGQGCLYLWDITKGDVLRAVSVGDHDPSVFIHQIQVIGNSIVICDHDRDLRIVRFPAILEKSE